MAIINVNSSVLSNTAGEFGTQGTAFQNTMTEMVEIVNGAMSVWTGDASGAYIGKFAQLQDDMDRMVRMIQEYSTDLQQIAANYEQAEAANEEAVQALSGDVIM